MRKFYTKNSELIEMLENNGIDLSNRDQNEGIEVTDGEARRIASLIREKAPEALDDYEIRTPWSELNYEQREAILRTLKENGIHSGEDAATEIKEYGGDFGPLGNIELDDPGDLKKSYEKYIKEN